MYEFQTIKETENHTIIIMLTLNDQYVICGFTHDRREEGGNKKAHLMVM